MGLDKTKPILLKDDFIADPFFPKNSLLKTQVKSYLPTLKEDVQIAKSQNVHYSFEYVLKRLLDNDKYISRYISLLNDQIEYLTPPGTTAESRLSAAVDTTGVDTDESHMTIYQEYLQQHLNDYHSNPQIYSLSSVHQNFIKSDMSNFDEEGARQNFQERHETGQTVQIKNDIVVNMEFSDSGDDGKQTNYVNVAVCNDKTNGVFKSTMNANASMIGLMPSTNDVSYIYKEWLSGMKELYIYVPTTFTFYNENPKIADADYYKNEDVKSKSTIVRLKINRRHFNIQNIYQAFICGQSLPLQIHNDNEGNVYYSDVVLPSVLKTLCLTDDSSPHSSNVECIYDEEQSTLTLYFTCYGTDAQAIRIIGD